MTLAHLELLACPDCAASLAVLDIAASSPARVQKGTLACSGCSRRFPIVGGVPRFVSSANYAEGFGFQWATHPSVQRDSYSGLDLSTRRFFDQTGWPRALPGEVILEVGCGAGRFTEPALATGATVVSLDYSDAVDVNYAAHGDHPNLLIVQGDVYKMPFKRGAFDNVFCFGVLQHTPDPAAAFAQLPEFLKPGGRLAIDVYLKHRGLKRLFDTKYWVRPVTRRLPPRTLYWLVNRYIRLVWPMACVIGRIPYVGIRINWKLLISDRRDQVNLPDESLREWAVLDTFDMLAPAYDIPQFPETVETWFSAAGLRQRDVVQQNALVVARTRHRGEMAA